MFLSFDRFRVDTKGGWQYIAHHEDEGAAMFLPLPAGTMAPISHLAINDAQKTLGWLRVLLGIVQAVLTDEGKSDKVV